MKLKSLVILAWTAWGASIVVTLWLHFGRVMHPHFLWLVAPLAVQALAGASACGWGLLRCVRGPARRRASGLALLGITPSLLWVSHFAHFGVGAAILDAGIRFHYPRRMHGERVVMIYDLSAHAKEQVKAMDRHIVELERLLGKSCDTKVHWIRGRPFGLEHKLSSGIRFGYYFRGMAFGSNCGDEPGPDDLTSLDRHEVTHFVIEHHRSAFSDPPTLLTEGWAEAHSGEEPGWLARRAWRRRQQHGYVPSLRELTSDTYYSKALHPVYAFGGPLVEYIERTYGLEMLFQLYTTCRQETFPEDCQRILGVTLEELDLAYWSDIERQITAMAGDEAWTPLSDVQLDDGVDQAAWEQFAKLVIDGFQRRQEALRQSCYSVEVRRKWKDDDGEDTEPHGSYEIVHDGDKHLCWAPTDGALLVVTPKLSFLASRPTGASGLKIDTHVSGIGYIDYRKHHDIFAQWEDASWMSLDMLWRDPPLEGIVTNLLMSADGDGRASCVVRLPPVDEREGQVRQTLYTFDPTQDWAPVEWRSEWLDFTDGREQLLSRHVSRFTYRRLEDGALFPESIVLENLDREGNVTGIFERRFSEVELGPPPADSFSPDRFGIQNDQFPSGAIPVYLLWLFGGTALSLVSGICLVLPWKRKAQTPSS